MHSSTITHVKTKKHWKCARKVNDPTPTLCPRSQSTFSNIRTNGLKHDFKLKTLFYTKYAVTELEFMNQKQILVKYCLLPLRNWFAVLCMSLIITYNLSNGSFDLPIVEFFTRPPYSSLRGQVLRLHHKRFRLNRRKAAFSVRSVEPCNKLPAFVVGSPSVEVFKSRLDACWTEVYPKVI